MSGTGRPSPSRVRLVDIAKEAGVSRATVSLALRDHASIPERTRLKIQRTAKFLGYVYNRGAANLRTASTQSVGVVVHDITNPYFAEVIAAIQDEMNAQGRVVLFGNTHDSHARQEKFVNTLREYNVDGIVMCPAVDTDPDWLEHVRGWSIPVVLYSRDIPDAGFDYAGGDNERGMAEATRHLVDLGHRRIAMIGVNQRISTGRERLAGYLEVLKEFGIDPDPSIVLDGPATRRFGMEALLGFAEKAEPPTAAVCFNDVVAFGVMLGLHRMGWEAGRDFSVIGFDDIEEAKLWQPQLGSIGFSRAELGRAVADLLTGRMNAPRSPIRKVAIRNRLHPRESCGRRPAC